ncbi:antitoxin of toxin-antitoxin stability system [Cupriavidus taiwanensis]|uniref:antitoxin of toxin-antitoxin stability system n=1 Tax=Cupriavidus taiwanensis TaxID=164546 RepID=UPI00157452EC|nr:antitoxin of toxin-antitoxin stability system [Cupriavidus taiwanensis]MDK3024688.1 antitoxin of toxin-antitoxin stability system [Cupriavidus taiwanensis]NSX14643.1 antitoxin of toxin-antitoxin stability system [Cupriavidus taiwanensis]
MLVSEEITFTLTLNSQLRDAFIAEAAAEGLTTSQVAEALIRQYLAQCQQARDEEALFQQMVEEGRASMRAGIGISNEQVEAESAAWCAALLRQP